MPSRFPTFCAVAALAAGLSACAGTSEPGRTAAANRPANATTAEALARIAHQSLDAGDPVSAVSMLKSAHAMDPSSPAILAELGRNLGALNAWSEAADAYRKAAALAPNDAAIHRGFAGALLALDQPVPAEQEYRAAIAAHEDAATLCGLGVTLDLQGRHDEAVAAFRRAYELDPQGTATRSNLALSLALWGSSEEAIGLLAPLAAAPDAPAKQRQNLALVFGLAGEPEQAFAVARIDLTEEAVRSNLAYYETLRALTPVLRMRAIMGAHDADAPLPPRKPEVASTEDDSAATPSPVVAPRAPARAPAKPSRTTERAVPSSKVASKQPEPSRISNPAADKPAETSDAKGEQEIAPTAEASAASDPLSILAQDLAKAAASSPASEPATADQPKTGAESVVESVADVPAVAPMAEPPLAASTATESDTANVERSGPDESAAMTAPVSDGMSAETPTVESESASQEPAAIAVPSPESVADAPTVADPRAGDEPQTSEAQPAAAAAPTADATNVDAPAADVPVADAPTADAAAASASAAVEPVGQPAETTPAVADAAPSEGDLVTVAPVATIAPMTHALAEVPTPLLPHANTESQAQADPDLSAPEHAPQSRGLATGALR